MKRHPHAAQQGPTRKFLNKYRRKFGHQCKIKFSQGKPTNITRPTATLVATDSLGNKHFAYYHKNKFGLWKFSSSTPILEFLRYCNPDDAKRALAKRHLSWAWSKPCKESSHQHPTVPCQAS